MAAGIMRDLYERENLSGLIESAGTMDWNAGNRADQRAIKVARDNGVDLSKHRARQITIADFERFDIIFAMDRSNEISLRKLAPCEHKHKIRLLGGDSEILDPYHSNESAFRSAYKEMHAYCLASVRNRFEA